MSKRRVSEVLSLENRVLLERLSEFEKALTRNSVNSLQEIVRSFEEYLDLHRRKEEEGLFPVMVKRLPGHGEPVTRRRLTGRQHGERLKEVRDLIQRGQRGKFLYEGTLFVTVLREHLQGADTLLFPLAERLLSPEEWEQVRAACDSISSSERRVARESGIGIRTPGPLLVQGEDR